MAPGGGQIEVGEADPVGGQRFGEVAPAEGKRW